MHHTGFIIWSRRVEASHKKPLPENGPAASQLPGPSALQNARSTAYEKKWPGGAP